MSEATNPISPNTALIFSYQEMKKTQLSSSVFLLAIPLLLTLSWAKSFSWPKTYTILDVEPNSQGFVTCLYSQSNNISSISQLTFTPDNSSFLPIWQLLVNNPRFNKPSTIKPSVIVTPVNETQIRTAIYCSKKHDYEVRIRGGGHDFEGLSYTADVPFVMIDLMNMKSIDISVENQTAWVQAGVALGEFYYAISQKTDTLFFPAGVCPTVGVSGYLSGGGYGNLMRKYGLGADNVLDIHFMDVNGNILDRESMGEDLFWALRGGGASSFGVVLAWKLRLVPVPEKVTVFLINKTLEEGATRLFHKYQYVAPTIDRNLLIRLQIFGENIGNTTQKTIRIRFEGIYQGSIDTLLPLMSKNFPELGLTREICEEMRIVESVLLFGGFTPSSTDPSILANRSLIPKMSNKGKSDYVRTPIPISGIEKIWEKIMENDGSEVLVINPFGGRMGDFSETALPYPHREGTLYQILEWVEFTDQPSDTTETSLWRIKWLREFNEFLAPYVSKNPREAYSNYNDLDLGFGSSNYREASIWGERYWKAANFKRLIQIKARVDPGNFFKHAQSIPVFRSPSLSSPSYLSDI